MRRGGANGGVGSGRRIVALAFASTLVLASCELGGGGGSTATGTPVAAQTAGDAAATPLTAPTTWDDGLDHVLVHTDLAGTAAPVKVPATDAPATDAPATDAPATDVLAGDGTVGDPVTVHRADGSAVQLMVPDGALDVIQPSTDAQRAAVAAAAEQVVGVLVQDRVGAIGAAGAVYVLTPGHLTEVVESAGGAHEAFAAPRAADSPGAIESAVPISVAAEPVAADPVSTNGDVVLDALRAVDGVDSATRVAPDLVAVATAGSRDALVTVPGVVGIDDDLLLQLADDPRQYEEWWLQNLGQTAQTSGSPAVAGADANALAGWQVSKGSGVVVAVIDTGVDTGHADLAAQIWSNPGEVCANGVDDDANGLVDDCHGYDFGSSDADPRPDAGAQSTEHGTHVAGIVGAAQNGVGVTGIAPQATIMPVKVSNTSGALGLGAIVAGIRYAADEGAKVINLSLATSPGVARESATAFEGAIAYARSKGVLVVAAAGNDGADIGARPAWPAAYSLSYDNVLTIGATTPSDGKASFSNYGAPVLLWAPGWFILSTVPNGGWNWLSGTSMAAPVAAGAAADLIASGQATTPSAVRARLIERAKATGAGPRLDLGAAVGVGLPASVQATYTGADALAADTDAALGIDVVASSLPAGTDRVRVSVAASTGGDVYAVAGLPAVFRTPDGASVAATTGDDGSFAPITIADTSALATGYHLDLTLNLPAGDFAVVTELLDASGATVGSAQAGFFSVTGPSVPTPTTTPADPGTSAPVTTAPATTAPATTAPGTGVPGGSSPVAPSPSTLPTLPSTTAPSNGSGGSVGTLPTVPGTSTPTGGGPITTQPGTSQPVTTQPVTSQPVTSQPVTTTTAPRTTTPVTTVPAPGTTAPTAPGTTTPAAPGTTSPATAPTTTAPVTTTPAPPPDVSGPWRLDSMSSRSGSTAGGDRVALTGRFPTTVPVYVWFGTAVAAAASTTGTSLDVAVPATAIAGVVDVSVRFTTSTASHVLTLAAAFTYVAPSAPGTTVPAAPGTTSPANPGTTAPATTAPATTAPGVPVSPTTVPTAPTLPRLGNLSLRSRPSTGTLSRLSIGTWRTACRSSSCPASSL